MTIQSSQSRNREHEAIPGIHWVSVGVSIAGLITAVLLNGVLDHNIKPLTILMVTGIPTVCFLLTQSLVKGDYDYQGFEKLLVKALSPIEKGSFDINNHAGFEMKDDRLISREGYHVIGIKISGSADPVFVRSNYRYILKELPKHYSVSFLLDTVRAKETETGSINELDLYVVLEIPQGVSLNDDFRKEALNSLGQMGTELSAKELSDLFQGIINKEQTTFDFEEKSGFFASPISFIRDEALAHLGDVETRLMALTLASLPERVGTNYQRLLNALSSRPGTIHVRFTSLGDPIAVIDWLDKKIIEKRTKSELSDVPAGARCNLLMTTSVISHGSKNELNQLMQDISRTLSYMPEDETCKFARDNALLRQVITSILPGSPDVLPSRRKMKVKDIREAAFYIPMPVDRGVEYPLLQFRTVHNTLFNFSYDVESPLYIWAAMGKGKSVLMALMILAHIERKYRGLDTMSFTLTAGDSAHFLLEIADLCMIQGQDEDLKWKPLDFHPLEAFFAFGATGIEKAAEWISNTCGIEDAATIEEVKNLLSHQKKLEKVKLSEFYAELEKYVYSKWPKDKVEPNHSSRNYLIRLKNFCAFPDSQYGYVFEPEETRKIDFLGIRHFYVAQDPAKREESTVLTVFFDLASLLFLSWETIVDRPLKVTADELGHLIKIKALSPERIDSIGSQGRKSAKYFDGASQKLSDIFGLSSDLSNTFQHFLTTNSADREHLEIILRASSKEKREEKIREFETKIAEVNAYRNQGRGYAWLYIDPSVNMHVVIPELPREKEWLTASDKPARDLKKDIRQKFGFSYEKTAKMLALYGPGRPPKDVSEYPKKEIIELIYDKILKHREDQGDEASEKH